MRSMVERKVGRRALLGGAIVASAALLLPRQAFGADSATTPSDALFSLVQSILSSMTETHYTYSAHIDASLGVYDCDCSQFVDYLLRQVAPAAYALIPKERGFAHPRANMLA